MKPWAHGLIAGGAVCAFSAFAFGTEDGRQSPAGRTLHVPADYATIQTAIDAAKDGDTVLVSPGIYQEGLRISGKSVRLVSEFESTRKKESLLETILDGTTIDEAGRVRLREQIILVEPDAGLETEIVGFTIRNGDDGIACHADVRIAHNYFTGNDDAIDYEGGGGLCEHNKFEKTPTTPSITTRPATPPWSTTKSSTTRTMASKFAFSPIAARRSSSRFATTSSPATRRMAFRSSTIRGCPTAACVSSGT